MKPLYLAIATSTSLHAYKEIIEPYYHNLTAAFHYMF
jgi:hypothetical protein